MDNSRVHIRGPEGPRCVIGHCVHWILCIGYFWRFQGDWQTQGLGKSGWRCIDLGRLDIILPSLSQCVYVCLMRIIIISHLNQAHVILRAYPDLSITCVIARVDGRRNLTLEKRRWAIWRFISFVFRCFGRRLGDGGDRGPPHCGGGCGDLRFKSRVASRHFLLRLLLESRPNLKIIGLIGK